MVTAARSSRIADAPRTLWRALRILVLLACSLAGTLQAQEIRDPANRLLARVDTGGHIVSPRNTAIGRFEADGGVWTPNNRKLGSIDETGRVTDAMNMTLGRIARDGRVYTSRNVLLGTVHEDGRITDAANRLLARTRGVRVRWAAAFWFFFFH